VRVAKLICPVCGEPSEDGSPLCAIHIVPLVPRQDDPDTPWSAEVAADAVATTARNGGPEGMAGHRGPVTSGEHCVDPDCPHGALVTPGCVACGAVAAPGAPAPRGALATLAPAPPRLRFPWGDEEVPADRPLPIGRESSPLAPRLAPYTNVGRRHAQVTLAGGLLTITDLNSVNGTFVNEERLEPLTPRPLRAGDEVRFAAGLRVMVVRGS
jgi:hypothetical protein